MMALGFHVDWRAIARESLQRPEFLAALAGAGTLDHYNHESEFFRHLSHPVWCHALEAVDSMVIRLERSSLGKPERDLLEDQSLYCGAILRHRAEIARSPPDAS